MQTSTIKAQTRFKTQDESPKNMVLFPDYNLPCKPVLSSQCCRIPQTAHRRSWRSVLGRVLERSDAFFVGPGRRSACLLAGEIHPHQGGALMVPGALGSVGCSVVRYSGGTAYRYGLVLGLGREFGRGAQNKDMKERKRQKLPCDMGEESNTSDYA